MFVTLLLSCNMQLDNFFIRKRFVLHVCSARLWYCLYNLFDVHKVNMEHCLRMGMKQEMLQTDCDISIFSFICTCQVCKEHCFDNVHFVKCTNLHMPCASLNWFSVVDHSYFELHIKPACLDKFSIAYRSFFELCNECALFSLIIELSTNTRLLVSSVLWEQS